MTPPAAPRAWRVRFEGGTQLVSTFGSGHNSNLSFLPAFSGQEVFHIFDLWSEDYLSKVIELKGRPAYVLSDHVLTLHPAHAHNLDFYGLPLCQMRDCRQWSWKDFEHETPLTTDYVFNFNLNKKQCSRFILMKLVEINEFSSYQYTWSGIGRQFDMSVIIDEIDNEVSADSPVRSADFKTKILAPINLSTRFYQEQGKIFDQTDVQELQTLYGRINYGGNKWTWDTFLNDLIGKSAVSLIAETGHYQKLSSLTEKTCYAFFSLTFPIWIGNWGQADAVAQIGLDVFPDVIDHSYQWYPTLIERCYWAFELNKRLLSDLKYAAKLRKLHLDRLLCNRTFLLNDGLGDYCAKQIAAYPEDLRSAAELVKKKFDSTRSNMTKFN